MTAQVSGVMIELLVRAVRGGADGVATLSHGQVATAQALEVRGLAAVTSRHSARCVRIVATEEGVALAQPYLKEKWPENKSQPDGLALNTPTILEI